MATTSVTMRVDCEDKAKAEQIFNALGLNMSTAFNMFIKQTIRCDGIPFEIGRASCRERVFRAV